MADRERPPLSDFEHAALDHLGEVLQSVIVEPPEFDEGRGAHVERTYELDDLLHLVCSLLNRRATQGSEPFEFPVPGALAEWARGAHRPEEEAALDA